MLQYVAHQHYGIITMHMYGILVRILLSSQVFAYFDTAQRQSSAWHSSNFDTTSKTSKKNFGTAYTCKHFAKLCQNSHFGTAHCKKIIFAQLGNCTNWKKIFWHSFKVERRCAFLFTRRRCTKKWTKLCQEILQRCANLCRTAKKCTKFCLENFQSCTKFCLAVSSKCTILYKLYQVVPSCSKYSKLCQTYYQTEPIERPKLWWNVPNWHFSRLYCGLPNYDK